MYNQTFNYQTNEVNAVNETAINSFLSHLNIQELQNLMDDSYQLNKFVDDLDIVKKQQTEKESLLTIIKSIAEYNLELEPRLSSAKTQLADIHEKAIQSLKIMDEKKLQLEACPSKKSSDVQLALLQTEVAKAEELSETITESFLSQRSNTEGFLNEFLPQRTIVYIRKIKSEKLNDIIRDNLRKVKQAATSYIPVQSPSTNSTFMMSGVQNQDSNNFNQYFNNLKSAAYYPAPY